MDTILWILLIVVVIGAVWWFRSRRQGGNNPDEKNQQHSEFDHERPAMPHGLTDAVPQPPLVMNQTPDATSHHRVEEPDSTPRRNPTDETPEPRTDGTGGKEDR